MTTFKRQVLHGALALVLSAGVIGCETTGESAGLGALIGAGAGAIIGSAAGGSDGALVGAAVGAGLGAAGGAVAHDVRKTRAEKVYTPTQTAETYHYEPRQGQNLVFEDASVQPSYARRGEFVEARMQYAILGVSDGTKVTERRIILRDDRVVSEVSAEEHYRNDGTWVSLQEFRIPSSWEPGQYTLEQIVSTSRLNVSGRVRFMVE